MTDGNYCSLAFAIKPSKDDQLTVGTKAQIFKHDLTYTSTCK